MFLCNPAIKLPVAAQMQPTVSVLSDRYSILIENSPFKGEPITNRAEPDSPKDHFSGPIQIYQHNILLSIRPKHVDGFRRQRNCSPGFHYLASSAVSSIYTTWQAMHTCTIWYLASRACTYRFCKLASRVRIAVYYFANSVQIRTCANFCTGSLGTHPKPRDRTSASCAFFQNVDHPLYGIIPPFRDSISVIFRSRLLQNSADTYPV